MSNATDFWGTAPDCVNAYTTSKCNGDGDGTIESVSTPSSDTEQKRAWQHLSYASLIPGRYGVASGSVSQQVGEVYPESRTGHPFVLTHLYFDDGPSYPTKHNFQHCAIPGGGIILFGTVTPKEMWNMDKKLDDGRPYQGKVRNSYGNVLTSCATSSAVSAAYQLDSDSVACSPSFLIDN
jgi:hypothetical protein